ncbi:sister chromatid cohesion protein-like protein Dcc1 [Lindgomyces ingoldianus]|uniref:Sister chromatid cohesion protein-like protein Dcc1 n=1 Tax=Lindgomyces ingoldianus TaxID=673940 RepID=A0ACB6R5R1_9PLEO|nr:sister chromatid cohesion protein-like protein Dcc1 [Lindgomyces ingoldianus]KAF2473781.1 sister chromatid cohesion protein-like protein Dcc1 [Lindgomyces ingoldianus]
MAALQDEGSVPFSIAHGQQHLRLLELPAEILELLDAPNPPPLSIKSQAASGASGTPSAKPAYAVLCTPTSSFQLRQVQTSNSLFVTQATLEAHGNEIPAPTICAIASCAATLELHPSTESSVVHLQAVLPVYDIVGGDVDVAGNGKSKPVIFSHIPLSDGQCESGWRELVAFEFAGSSYRPSANTLSQAWKSISAAALAEGVKLDSQFLTEDILRLVDEEGYPSDLILAILRLLAADNQDKTGPWSCLDRRKTACFVGKTLLEARQEKKYLTAEFLDDWRDLLPGTWREIAKLDTISGAYTLPSSTTIRFNERLAAAINAEDVTSNAASSSRKWHERFGRARQR